MVIESNITKMFGIKHPIVNAPMGPFQTDDMAIELCEAGGLGVVSHTPNQKLIRKMFLSETATIDRSLSTDYIQESLLYVAEHTDKPFGFNIRTGRNEMDAAGFLRKVPKFIMENPKLREQVLYALTSAGSPRLLPKSKNFQKLREISDIKHFHVAPALWLADKCVASGCDGLVLTGTEGGGHQSYEKVSTLVLLQQVRQKYPDLPILACGGVANAEGLAAVIGMGGGGIVMGTRFIATKESGFHENYQNVIPPAKAGDTRLVTGMLGPIRLWKNKYCMSKELVPSKENLVEIEGMRSPEELLEDWKHYMIILDGEMEDSAVLMGQSAGVINSVESLGDMVNTIISGAEECIKKAYANIK